MFGAMFNSIQTLSANEAAHACILRTSMLDDVTSKNWHEGNEGRSINAIGQLRKRVFGEQNLGPGLKLMAYQPASYASRIWIICNWYSKALEEWHQLCKIINLLKEYSPTITQCSHLWNTGQLSHEPH